VFWENNEVLVMLQRNWRCEKKVTANKLQKPIKIDDFGMKIWTAHCRNPTVTNHTKKHPTFDFVLEPYKTLHSGGPDV
jgi:hypothetical protein